MRTIDELTNAISKWHYDRKITVNGNSTAQLLKLAEEMGELASAINKKDKKEIVDALGDMYVVMVAISELEGTNMAEAIETAYNEIKDRRGYLNELGVFIKEEK